MSELEKMKAVNEKSQAIGSFIEEFLKNKGFILAKWHEHTKECYVFGKEKYETPLCRITTHQPITAHYDIEKLLAEYFGINLKKAEEEKRKILDDLRRKK